MIIDTQKFDRAYSVIAALKELDLNEKNVPLRYQTNARPFVLTPKYGSFYVHSGYLLEVYIYPMEGKSVKLVFHVLSDPNIEDRIIFSRHSQIPRSNSDKFEYKRQQLVEPDSKKTFTNPNQAAEYIKKEIMAAIGAIQDMLTRKLF